MTAIIGFTCHDCVLMMADTEESTTEATKSSCDKLYHFVSPSGYILTGGAGDAHLIDCANQELATFFGKGMPGTPDEPFTPQVILDGLNIFAQKFFSETTEEYMAAGFDPVPGFEMLIAVNIFKRGTFLFKLYLNKVLWIEPPNHECIGIGMWTVDPMLRNFQFVPQKETALFCGIRMMYHAKNTMQGVGGKTEAVALSDDGSLNYYGTANTALIESLVANFEEYVDKFVYTSVSNVSKEFPEIDENCEKHFQDVPDILKKYRDKYKKLLDNPIL
jgi:hypothetical protein